MTPALKIHSGSTKSKRICICASWHNCATAGRDHTSPGRAAQVAMGVSSGHGVAARKLATQQPVAWWLHHRQGHHRKTPSGKKTMTAGLAKTGR